METLTDAERTEMAQLYYDLLEAPGTFSKTNYFHRMPAITAHSRGDIETMRVYAKYVFSTIASTYHLDVMIASAHSLGHKPSEFLTREHVTAWEGWISRALRKNPAYKNSEDVKACAVLLANFSQAGTILSLINDRGVADADSIKTLVDDMNSGALALAEGAL